MTAAPEWTQGYVSDIPYTYGFYRELAPNLLRMALTDAGFDTPDVAKPFRYCELGTGFGVTLNTLAAANPMGEFYGTDFNPQQVAEARALAAAGGLSNVSFYDDAFADFIERDLPSFDIIAVHGIYSWISDENRQAIVRFIDKFLRPGGLAYVSYNAMPGWGPMAPVRYLMARATEGHLGSSLSRVDRAFGLLDQLMDAKAAYFLRNPQIKDRLNKTRDQQKSYIAHEYFNGYWNPMFHDQVATELAEARLSFATSAHLCDHVDAVNLSKEGQRILSEVEDRMLRETVRDFLTGSQFRRDIYVRGAPPITAMARQQRVAKQRLALVRPAEKLEMKQSFPVGQVSLQEKVYRPLVEILDSEGPLTVEAMANHDKLSGTKFGGVWQACQVLSGLGFLEPVFDDAGIAARRGSAAAFNRAVMERAIESEQLRYLAIPATGSGMSVSRAEMLFMLAEGNLEADPPQFVWDIFKARGQRLKSEGKILEKESDNIAQLRQEYANFDKGRRSLFQQLGVL